MRMAYNDQLHATDLLPDASCTYRASHTLQCKAFEVGILCLLFAIEAQLVAC